MADITESYRIRSSWETAPHSKPVFSLRGGCLFIYFFFGGGGGEQVEIAILDARAFIFSSPLAYPICRLVQ